MGELRQIDALIAEALGAKDCPHDASWKDPEYDGYCKNCDRSFPGHYSTDIALAIGVLEKMRRDSGWVWTIAASIDIQVGVGVHEKNHKAYVCPIPEAICRHVLHVLGVEIPKGANHD